MNIHETTTAPTERQLAIHFYLSLSRAANDWSWVLKGMMKGEGKARLLALHNAEKDLRMFFIRELGEQARDGFTEDAAMWSDVLMLLKKGNAEDKNKFLMFLKAYMAGEIVLQEDSNQDNAA